MPARPSARALAPGLLLAVLIAVIARGVHGILPPAAQRVLAEVILAVLFGLLLGNLTRLPPIFAPGIRFSYHTILRTAIVFLGASLSFQRVLAIGGKALLMVVLLMTVALTLAWLLGRAARIAPRLAALIGVGTAVCGNSAIAAAAPVIDASDEEVSFAIAYSDAAGRIATAVKLTRNALMGVVLVGLGLAYRRRGGTLAQRARQSVPGFVLGFLAMAVLNSLGLLDRLSEATGLPLPGLLDGAAKGLILVALSGVGLSARAAAMRGIGARPLYLGLLIAATTSTLGFLLIHLLGPAAG
jgi:uncharacterized membrane protein YadS